MMIPSQKRAVRDWVVLALADAGKPIPLERVVWVPQDAVELERPYVTLQATGSARRGPAPEKRSRGGHANAEHRSKTLGTTTVSITVVGRVNTESLDDAADAYLAELAPRLQVPDIDEPLRVAQISVNSVAEFPAVDRLTGQSQWETRAALDVTFNYAVVVTQTPGTVQEVEITGTTDPDTGLGTFTVGT